MEELDGDDVRVSSRGRYAERDIVQVDLTGERKSWSQKAQWDGEAKLAATLPAFLFTYLSSRYAFSLPAFIEHILFEE